MDDNDSVDAHITRWRRVLPDLDPVSEGVVVRMARLTKHLAQVKAGVLATYDLRDYEYATLHALAGRSGTATPTELAADLRISPSATTSRLYTLEKRGFVHRNHSTGDRRRVDIELTPEGWAAWHTAIKGHGAEEDRLMAALTPAERSTLDDLLRRMLHIAEHDPTPACGNRLG